MQSRIIQLFALISCLILHCLSLSSEKKFRPSLEELQNSNKTPVRSVYGVKSIQPDYWNIDDLVGNGAGGVAINYIWASYQPTKKTPPCAENEEEYDGYCFWIDQSSDSISREYTMQNLMITAVIYFVPEWARVKNINCTHAIKGFCSPDDGQDYGRFAGFLAKRYNGQYGNGRIVEFVIHNEVNAADWFDVGCIKKAPCSIDYWVRTYASSYTHAFDYIRLHQPMAPVLISLEHHFDYTFDQMMGNDSPVMSGKTFIETLVPLLGQRDWALAFHSYPKDLLRAEFGPNDMPKITFGNLNILIGWLITTYPKTPSAWRIYLTENGINSIVPYSTPAKQADYLCRAFRNIISTPFVENFVYHRLKDHPDETKSGLGLGLVDQNNKYKQAWSVWALSNRFDVDKLNCGFETLPYIILKLGYRANFGHWTTTRDLPPLYSQKMSFKIFRNEDEPGLVMLYECRASENHNFVSKYMNCEQQIHLGPLGYVFLTQQAGTVPLHRCIFSKTGDHFISTNMQCDGQTYEETLGYAYGYL